MTARELFVKLRDTAEFCERIGAGGMDGLSAANLAHDVLAALPLLDALVEIAELAETQTAEWERYNVPELRPVPVREMRALLARLDVVRSGT